jgi:hypothetical protein
MMMRNLRNNTEADHVETTLSVLVGSETSTDSEETGYDVGRDSHELSNLGGVSKTLDNGRKENRDGVERGVDADGDEHVNPDLPVFESILGELDVEGIREDGTIFFKAANDLLALRVVEELGSVGVIVHNEEGHDSKDHGEETLDDEDPSPTIKATNTVHLHDTTGEETTESTGSSGSGEEDGHAETTFVTLVPEGDVVSDTGEETTLSETESHTTGKEPCEVVGDTHEGGADGPGDHDGRNPDGGAEALHGHVGGDLGSDIEGEEDCDSDL